MADFLQSEIRLIHSVETQTPTSTQRPTAAETQTQNTEEIDEALTKSIFGKTAVKRRVFNTALNVVGDMTQYVIRDTMHKAQMLGDQRVINKQQNELQMYKNALNSSRGYVGAILTGHMVGSVPVFMGIYFAMESLKRVSLFAQSQQELRHLLERQEKEMFIARKNQERLIVGVYNRR